MCDMNKVQGDESLRHILDYFEHHSKRNVIGNLNAKNEIL